VFGGQGKELKPITDEAVPATVIEALKTLPQAKATEGT
jgi:hypothetical protein